MKRGRTRKKMARKFRRVRGLRDAIPGGFVIGRIGKGKGAPMLIPFTPNANGSVGGGGGGSGVKFIAVELYAGGLMRANEVVGQIIAPVEFTLPAGLATSYAKAVTASTGVLVLTIRKATAAGGVGSSIGTITFTGSTEGVFSFASDVSFAIGDRLLVQCPSPANVSLASTTILFMGNL